MLQMGNEVKRIIDGNAEDDRRDADDNHGYLIVDKRKGSHRKEPAPGGGEYDE